MATYMPVYIILLFVVDETLQNRGSLIKIEWNLMLNDLLRIKIVFLDVEN